jgi:hypothetical protein
MTTTTIAASTNECKLVSLLMEQRTAGAMDAAAAVQRLLAAAAPSQCLQPACLPKQRPAGRIGG